MNDPKWNSSESGPATSADYGGKSYDVTTDGSGTRERFTDDDGVEHERYNDGSGSSSD